MRLYEIASGELLGEYQAGTDGDAAGELKVIFSPDGRRLAVTQAAPTRQPVVLLDAATLEPVAASPRAAQWRWQPNSMAFSQDGQHLAVTLQRVEGVGKAPRGRAVGQSCGTSTKPEPTTSHPARGRPGGVALSPDGQTLLHDHSRSRSTTSPPAGPAGGERSRRPDRDEPRRAAPCRLRAEAGWCCWTPGPGSSAAAGGQRVRPLLRRFSGDGEQGRQHLLREQEAMVWDVASGACWPGCRSARAGRRSTCRRRLHRLHRGIGHSLRQWDVEGDRRFVSQLAASKPDG